MGPRSRIFVCGSLATAMAVIGSVSPLASAGPPEIKDVPSPPELKEVVAPPEVKDVPAALEIKDVPAPPEVKDVPAPPEVKDVPAPPEVKDVPAAPEAKDVPAPAEVKEAPEPAEVKDPPAAAEVSDTHTEGDPKGASESPDDKNLAAGTDQSGNGQSGGGTGSVDTKDVESQVVTSPAVHNDDSGHAAAQAPASSEAVVTPAVFHDLAQRENPDFDASGFPVRRGEVVAIDPDAEFFDHAQALGFSIVSDERLSALGLRVLRVRSPDTAQDAIVKLRAESGATAVDLDHYFTVGDTLDGRADLASAWSPKVVQSDRKAWTGVIDTPVQRTGALRTVRFDDHDMATPSNLPWRTAHGTAVASILAQQGVGRVSSVNVFSNDAHPYASADTIARAVEWLVASGVPVINISIAGPRNALVDRVIAAASKRGVAIVAAAGNAGPAAPPAYPAASPGAIAVTAVDKSKRIYMRANQGAYVTIAAPGVDVLAAAADGSMRTYSGTSFAAPVVAAYLAHCIGFGSAGRTAKCIQKMERSAVDLGAAGRDPVYGYGLVGG